MKQKVGRVLKLGDRRMGIQQIILLTCMFENCCNDRKERKRKREGMEGGRERTNEESPQVANYFSLMLLIEPFSVQFSSVQSLSHVGLFATP